MITSVKTPNNDNVVDCMNVCICALEESVKNKD